MLSLTSLRNSALPANRSVRTKHDFPFYSLPLFPREAPCFMCCSTWVNPPVRKKQHPRREDDVLPLSAFLWALLAFAPPALVSYPRFQLFTQRKTRQKKLRVGEKGRKSVFKSFHSSLPPFFGVSPPLSPPPVLCSLLLLVGGARG